MKRKVNTAACLLLALALFLLGTGIWNAMSTRGLLQYVLIAPKGEGEIASLVQKKDNESLAIGTSTVTATANGVFVNSKETDTSAQGTLFAGSEGFFEVYPRFLTAGRLFSETELKRGEKLAVLDEDMAFKLFPTIDPIGQKVQVGSVELEIVGVVRHSRGLGEVDEFSIYAPLLAVQDEDFSIVTLSAKPMPGSGMSVRFENLASSYWSGGGYCYNLEKEAARALLPVRYTLVIFGFAIIIWLVRSVNSGVASSVSKIRQRMERDYLPKVLPRIFLNILGFLVLYALIAAAAWLLATWAAQPLYQFPEWVPDNIVEWSSIRKVFWNLAIADAQMLNAATPQVRILQYWAGVIHWGTLFALISALLLCISRKREE